MYFIKGANDLISKSLSKCVDGLHFIPAILLDIALDVCHKSGFQIYMARAL